MLKRVLIFLIASISCAGLYAQEVKSPYSSIGLGTLYGTPNVANSGMAGIGIATPSLYTINDANPALLYYNRYTTFQVGATYESRSIEGNDFNGAKAKVTNADANLTYLSLAFPILKRKWSMSMGLKPYSLIDYDKRESYVVKKVDPSGSPTGENTTVKNFKKFKGSGGVNRAYLSTGGLLYKGLSIGVTGNFYFGALNRNEFSQLVDTLQFSGNPFEAGQAIQPIYTTAFTEEIIIRQLKLDAGIAYRATLPKNIIMHLGATYTMGGDFSTESIQTLERRYGDSEDSQQNIEKDISEENLNLKIPDEFGVGISFMKPSKWTAGLEFKTADWSKYENPITNDEDFLGKSYRLALGGEYTPEFNSIKNYLKRMTYRLGTFYKQTPYVVGGEKIDDWGVTTGFSMPIRYSSIDFAFKFGQRGVVTQQTYKEDYFQLSLGITFGDNSWFIKRKYD